MRAPSRLRSLPLSSPRHPASAAEPGEVNIYSYRQPYLINPLLKEFTDETGIKVNVIFAEKGLIERIQAEGRNSPADLLLTVDVGNLTQATDAGIAQPIQSPALDAAIPAAYRAADGQWFGLTRRARVVYASKERVKQDAHHLRGARRSEMARQDLHPLGPACLQRRADRLDDRGAWRGLDRAVAERA